MAKKNNLKRFYFDVEELREDLHEFNENIGKKELWQWNIASGVFIFIFLVALVFLIMSVIAFLHCGAGVIWI